MSWPRNGRRIREARNQPVNMDDQVPLHSAAPWFINHLLYKADDRLHINVYVFPSFPPGQNPWKFSPWKGWAGPRRDAVWYDFVNGKFMSREIKGNMPSLVYLARVRSRNSRRTRASNSSVFVHLSLRRRALSNICDAWREIHNAGKIPRMEVFALFLRATIVFGMSLLSLCAEVGLENSSLDN